MNQENNILVLGVGNILFTDEGLGVRAIEKLQADYDFSDNVTVMDGGTLGTKLMDYIMQSSFLIVVDAVHGGQEPGTIYRLTDDDMRKSLAFKNSLHDTDLVDTLIYCDLAGNRPDAIVIGVEPHDLSTMAVELSEGIFEKMPKVLEVVLKEIEAAGGSYTPRAS